MAGQPLEPVVGSLLRAAGCTVASFSMEPLLAGRNNRVFLVEAGSRRAVAKWYYHDARDPRDRLTSEFFFLRHAWSLGLRCIPEPLAADPASHIALYAYIEGRRLAAEELEESHIAQAARFFAALNDPASRQLAGSLAAASEACFSVEEHFKMVDGRLARLAAVGRGSPAEKGASDFIEALHAAWSQCKARILSRVGNPGEPLPGRWRCLSPSDFGFHNALLCADGGISFLDFEYAGWDDPAKTFGDFFAHPGVPVSARFYERFVAEAAAPFGDAHALMERARLLSPVFTVKWCCIMLNEFLPEATERRRFADPAGDMEAQKMRQLEKAQRLFARLS